MAEVKTVVGASAVPAVIVSYHFKSVPEAVKSATVALLQTDCAAAMGGIGSLFNRTIAFVRIPS